MPKEITTTVYTYAELVERAAANPKAKDALERAAQWLREATTCGDYWFEYIYEMWEKALTQIGFPDSKISFRGFCSQGDGASFTCESVDCERLVRFLAAKIKPVDSIKGFTSKPDSWESQEGEDFRGWIVKNIGGKRADAQFRKLLRDKWSGSFKAEVKRTSSHYVHYNTCDFCVEGSEEAIDELLNEFQTAGEELREALSKAIYKSLEDEYWYQTSDEAIKEMADANEYTFTISGKREG